MSKIKQSKQSSYQYGTRAGPPTQSQPNNIFNRGKGGKKKSKKGGSKSSKGYYSGKGYYYSGGMKSNFAKKVVKGKGKGVIIRHPVDLARLVFEPREFPVGVLTEIDVTLTTQYYRTTAEVDFFNLYIIDGRGVRQNDVPETTLVRVMPGSWAFEGSFLILSTVPRERFNFEAIPVIDGIEDPWSTFATSSFGALRSFPSGAPPLTASPNEQITSAPTRAPVTATPTEPTTSTPTRAPVTAAPTGPTTSTPTRAPSTAAAVPTRNPTGGGQTPAPALTPTDPTLIPTRNPTGGGQTPAPALISTDQPTSPPTSMPTAQSFSELLTLQGAPGAQFGRSVALSTDGSIIAVGAPFNSELASEAGRVGLFQLVGNSARVLFDFSGAQSGLRVGQSLSMSTGIEPILAIGGNDFVDVYPLSQFLGSGGGEDPDLIFDRFEADFVDEDFGSAISISGDGATLAIGAPRAFIGDPDLGMVQVYLVGTGQQIGSELLGVAGNDFFGSAVSLSGDGTTLAVGAFSGALGAGYATMFSLNGGSFGQVGQSIEGRQVGDNLGRSISLSADGQTVAIGAYQADAASGAGYVQVYRLGGTTWTQVGVDIVGPNDGDQFGISVALTPDALFLAIGANVHDSGGFTNNGLVQVYENRSGTWTPVGGEIVGNADSRNLGVAVALSADGQTLAAGGPLSTAPVDTNIGETVVYVF
jgi:hypothetical protein